VRRGKKREAELVGPWRSIHGAIWLIGLAILFWRGWWWPGLLVLIAVSTIAEAVIKLAVPSSTVPEDRTEEVSVAPPPVEHSEPHGTEHRADLLPSECQKCGAPIRGNEVKWTGSRSADCPYCGANLAMRSE